MKLLRRKRAVQAATHTGIRLRISLPGAGSILDATSDHLYYVAKYGGASVCLPSCLPGCDKHGWLDVLSPPEMELIQREPNQLVVEIKPVQLPE